MPNTGKLSTCVLELDYEKVDAYALKIETTDSGNPRLSFTGTIIVNVTDVNEAPTNITLTNDEVRRPFKLFWVLLSLIISFNVKVWPLNKHSERCSVTVFNDIVSFFRFGEKQWQLKNEIAETHGPRSNRSQFEVELEVAHNQPNRSVTHLGDS